MKLKTKLRLFDTFIIPAALYALETWARSEGNNNKIEAFEIKCPRHWDKVNIKSRT